MPSCLLLAISPASYVTFFFRSVSFSLFLEFSGAFLGSYSCWLASCRSVTPSMSLFFTLDWLMIHSLLRMLNFLKESLQLLPRDFLSSLLGVKFNSSENLSLRFFTEVAAALRSFCEAMGLSSGLLPIIELLVSSSCPKVNF